MRRVKRVVIGAHPSLYSKMEELRMMYQRQGVRLSQLEVTEILSKRINLPNNIDIIGGGYAKAKTKRRPY
jgi:hypothetical protein